MPVTGTWGLNVVYIVYKHFGSGPQAPPTHTIHALHYGTTVFEGIRAKPNQPLLNEGVLELAVINFERNAQRFLHSMEELRLKKPSNLEPGSIPPSVQSRLKPYDPANDVFIPPDFTTETLKELVFSAIRRNAEEGTITPEKGEVYIRPLCYRAAHPDGKLGVYSLQHDIILSIQVLEWGDYLPDGLRLVVHPDGVADPIRRIKSGANYALGSLAKNQATAFQTANGVVRFDDALLTDMSTARHIEEATGANFFAFADRTTLVTPPLQQYVLPGITRATAIELARNLGFTVQEEDIPLDGLAGLAAAFLTGTATGLRSIDLVYDPVERKTYQFEPEHEAFLALQREFNSLITGGDVAPANKNLQARVRSVIVPCNGAP